MNKFKKFILITLFIVFSFSSMANANIVILNSLQNLEMEELNFTIYQNIQYNQYNLQALINNFEEQKINEGISYITGINYDNPLLKSSKLGLEFEYQEIEFLLENSSITSGGIFLTSNYNLNQNFIPITETFDLKVLGAIGLSYGVLEIDENNTSTLIPAFKGGFQLGYNVCDKIAFNLRSEIRKIDHGKLYDLSGYGIGAGLNYKF